MTSTPSPDGDRADLIRALAVLCEKPGSATGGVAEAVGVDPPDPADHTELFVHQLPPYASIYLDAQGKIGGEARDRIGGFWRAVGIVPPPEPDHLAALLGLWAGLVERATSEEDGARRELITHSARMLVWEHLASWSTPYLHRLSELADASYSRWAALLGDTIAAGLPLESDDRLPGHLAVDPPPLPDGHDVVDHVLTPVRSGILVTKSDLYRAATELGLGIRIGERAFALRSLLDQDRAGILGWLASEADRQRTGRSWDGGAESIATVWDERARRTASMLGEHVAAGPGTTPS